MFENTFNELEENAQQIADRARRSVRLAIFDDEKEEKQRLDE